MQTLLEFRKWRDGIVEWQRLNSRHQGCESAED